MIMPVAIQHLSMVYCYNANAVDGNYDPLPPPAVGFDFFQGPIVDGVQALMMLQFLVEKRLLAKTNLPMTACFLFCTRRSCCNRSYSR